MTEWNKQIDVLGAVNRGNPCESGLCTLCRADCKGKCETWLSSMVGRRLLYPRDFGWVTAGSANTTHVGVNYNALRIRGYVYGAKGLPSGLTHNPDDCIFPNVSVENAIRPRTQDQGPRADDDRGVGLHVHCPPSIGSRSPWGRRWSVFPIVHRRKRRRRRSAERARGRAWIQSAPRARPPHRHVPPLLRRLRRGDRPAQRRGYPQRCGRVRGRQVRRQGLPSNSSGVRAPRDIGGRNPGPPRTTTPCSSNSVATWWTPTPRCPASRRRSNTQRHPRLCAPQSARLHQTSTRPAPCASSS